MDHHQRFSCTRDMDGERWPNLKGHFKGIHVVINAQSLESERGDFSRA